MITNITVIKMNIFFVLCTFVTTAPSSSPTWHVAVGAGGDVARRATATGLRGHAARHGVQHQDDGVDEGWVRADQPDGGKQNVNPSHFPLDTSTSARRQDAR